MTNEEYAISIQNGNKELAGELWKQIEKYMTFKVSEFYRAYGKALSSCGITFEDFKQESYFIMLNMVNEFNPEKDFKLLSYADFQFKNHIVRRLLHLNGNNAFCDMLNTASSLDEELSEGGENDGLSKMNIIPDERATQAFEDTEERMYQAALRKELEASINALLSENENKVIKMIYFDGLSKSKIAEIFNCNYNSIRKLELKGLSKLRRSQSLKASFASDYINAKAYRSTGLSSFKNNRASSQEIITEWLEGLKKS